MFENVQYYPEKARSFTDAGKLSNFLKFMFRTDENQQWTDYSTCRNLYFLPGESGEWEFLDNVATYSERLRLQTLVEKSTRNIPLDSLRNDVISIYPDKGLDGFENIYDYFCYLCLDALPALYASYDATVTKKQFLEKSFVFVLLVDKPSSGGSPSVYHIRRLYIC